MAMIRKQAILGTEWPHYLTNYRCKIQIKTRIKRLKFKDFEKEINKNMPFNKRSTIILLSFTTNIPVCTPHYLLQSYFSYKYNKIVIESCLKKIGKKIDIMWPLISCETETRNSKIGPREQS